MFYNLGNCRASRIYGSALVPTSFIACQITKNNYSLKDTFHKSNLDSEVSFKTIYQSNVFYLSASLLEFSIILLKDVRHVNENYYL